MHNVTLVDHVTAAVHESGAVLFDRIHGRLFTTNRTGARVWQAIEEGLSVETIVEQLSRSGETESSVRAHTVRFVSELEAHCLVQRTQR